MNLSISDMKKKGIPILLMANKMDLRDSLTAERVSYNAVNIEILASRKFGDFVKKMAIMKYYWRIFNLAVARPLSMTLCVCAKILAIFNLAISCSIAKSPN